MTKLEELSKEISYALRHEPDKYQLEMNNEGWVLLEQLLNSFRKNTKWKNITEEDIYDMIEKSEKKRHEIVDGKIRAFYGHSISKKIEKEESEPPVVLYHGTARHSWESIKKVGLHPQKRQYVHLSMDVETAKKVGLRHDDEPYILIIDSKMAWDDGIKFYIGNDKVWLADSIPSKYIKKMD